MKNKQAKHKPIFPFEDLQEISDDQDEKDNIKDKISLDEHGEISDVENVLSHLDASFAKVAAITDPVKQEYKLLQEAKRLDLPSDSYRRMFETYYLERLPKKNQAALLKPLTFVDQRLGDFVKWCENISLYSLATVIGQFTLLAAMASYFMDAPQRKQQAIDDARQEIRDQKSVEYSQSRIDAIKKLNKYCESLLGEQAPNANLEGIQLNQCYRFQLGMATFTQWPPQFYRYEGFNMAWMNLAGANLAGANLEGVNLEGANLEGANLEGANLKGANLKRSNLKGAILRVANLEGADLQEANLDDARMSRVDLRNANLNLASIVYARLLSSDLQGASLILANLSDSNLNRANLQGADLYKTNLKGAKLRYADLRRGTILLGTQMENANLKRVKLLSADQLKRSYNWEKALKDNQWEVNIANESANKYKVGLLIPNDSATFKLYQQGMEKFAKENPQVEIIALKTGETIEQERLGIRQLLAADVDAILLRPLDPEKSVTSILEAYINGVVTINIGDCINKKSQKVLFACYENNAFKMGYDLGKYMASWYKKNLVGQAINVGLVDGADSTRVYPYFQGFRAGMTDSNVTWNPIASTNAQTPEELPKVKEMLQKNPNINVLWSGSEIVTNLALQAVKELNLQKKVSVFGIVPLTRRVANDLLDPNVALQSIVDESASYIGYIATKHAIEVIEGKASQEFQYIPSKHRLLTQSDRPTVNQLLSQTLDVEKNDLKPAEQLKEQAVIPSEVSSSLDDSISTLIPAITDKNLIDKLQEELDRLILENFQISSIRGNDEAAVPLSDNLVYRVLVNKNLQIVSYEPVNKVAADFIKNVSFSKWDFQGDVSNQPQSANENKQNKAAGPVAEFKVIIAPNGTVEVRWGEAFIRDE